MLNAEAIVSRWSDRLSTSAVFIGGVDADD